MAITFPATPNTDDIYSVGDRSWQWNGTYWEVQPTPAQTFSVTDTAPGSPEAGDIWYRSDTSQTLIYYDNTWVEIGHSANIANFLADSDADTKIQLEESADEDTIRFDTAGFERLTITSAGHLVPSDNETYDLGASDKRFRDLYLSGNTIDLGGATISYDGSTLRMGSVEMDATGSGSMTMPSGTTAERPASPSAGMFRFNETTGEPEWYSSAKSRWIKFRSTPETILQFLVVGGGGGGGFDGGGGGGAGGYRSSVVGESSGGGSSAENTISVISGTSYTVTVGAGGTAGTSSSGGQTVGGNSVFGSITSLGGGWGANGIPGGPGPTGQVGGSGGGGAGRTNGVTHAGGAGTTNQGYAGGSGIHIASYTSNGGGGGGASEVGANMVWTGSNPTPGGDGGDGVSSNIDGTPTYRAGGGGGGANNDAGNTGAGGTGGLGGGGNGVRSGAAGPGTANTGGGGGGGYRISGSGAAGGSGVVIVRYEGDLPTISAGLTYVTSTIGDDTVLTFTAGTGTVTW